MLAHLKGDFPPWVFREMTNMTPYSGALRPPQWLDSVTGVSEVSLRGTFWPQQVLISTAQYQCIYGKGSIKHCQRHNGPRVLTLELELSLQLNRMPLGLVPNLANCMWCHQNWFQFGPPCATCISYKFDHQMAKLHWLQNCPQDGATCISSKFGHQMAPLA